MPNGFVYILECSDGSYYTGSTNNIEFRLRQHQDGRGANHTKKRLPVKLVFLEEFQRIDDAFCREKQIQGWSREKKETLIDREFNKLPKLSECKNDSHSKNVASTPLSHRDKEIKYYSNGKLLLSGEYLVLDGAKALAIPTKYGQDLIVSTIQEPSLVWESLDVENNCWFQAEFRISDLRIIDETFDADSEDSKESIAKTLQTILLTAQNMNPEFLASENGFHVKTQLNFPREWGLGTSSTLINNIAQWAKVDAFELLHKSFGGSGYDIACAQNDMPIYYQIVDDNPMVKPVDFQPSFEDQLYFVYLNIKQDSKKGIQRYQEDKKGGQLNFEVISSISEQMTKCESIQEFEKLIETHEQEISKIIKNKPIKTVLFNDYFGAIKSLGAWGGDFVLVTGNKNTPAYFKEKGFETVIPYRDMVL